MSDKAPCFEVRRFEKMEDRLNEAERELTKLDNELSFVRAELTRRIEEVDKNTMERIEQVRVDLRERIDTLRTDLADIKDDIGADLNQLNDNIIAVNDSVQQLYVAQSGTRVKVGFNEKIIWAIATIAGSVLLYFIQDLIKAGGAG